MEADIQSYCAVHRARSIFLLNVGATGHEYPILLPCARIVTCRKNTAEVKIYLNPFQRLMAKKSLTYYFKRFSANDFFSWHIFLRII